MTDEPGSKKAPYGGVQGVADMLNVMDQPSRDRLLQEISAKDPELARQVRERMFVFDDLIQLHPEGVQLLVREVPRPLWILSMRNASQALRDHVYGSLTQRAADELRGEVDSQGPKRLSDITAAQSHIMEVARRLESEGRLTLSANSK